MPKVRRGGYVFVAWKGDHSPYHVHVFKDGKLIVKWNLEGACALSGRANKKIRKLLQALQREGKL